MDLNEHTDNSARYGRLYGLIGYPLGHSFSQNFFNQKFESEKIDAKYVNFEIPDIKRLPEILATYPNLAGFNVTIPYKEQVLPYLDAIDSEARKIGAVNVVKIFRQPDGSTSLKGYNSDAIGFSDSIRQLLRPDVHTRALVLGTGGAAKAVAAALDNLGVQPLMVSRRPTDGAISYAQVTPALLSDYKVVVNATPVGMYPDIDRCPDIPYEALTPDHLCYDLLYNPGTTLFMKKAAEAGAVTKNGLEMLLLQAFAAWNIWNK